MSGTPFLFVSHVSEDRSPAAELVAELEQRGVQCWIAPRNVRPGKPYDDEIAEAIDDCVAMLLIFSEHCNESEYIRREITVAGEARKLVIPFRIEDVQPKRGLRIRLADLHWIDGFIAREQAVDAIIRSVSKDTGAWRGNHRASGPDTAVAAPPPVAPATVPEPAANPPTPPAALSDNEPAPAPAPTTSAEDNLPPSLREHLRKADAGDPESLYVVGLCLCTGGYGGPLTQNSPKALEALRRSAAEGHAGAQHKIGLLHQFGPDYGFEPKKDVRLAAEWFAKAAEQGHRGALCDLARLYEHGDGVESDRGKALALYRDAVERGAFWARWNVARLSGAPADARTLHEEIEIPALSESDMAALRQAIKVIVWPFSRPFPVPRWDIDDFVGRASAGEVQAQYLIGYILRQALQVGLSESTSYETPLRWLRLSATQGFPPAQFALGQLYEDGKGVERDSREAADLFEKAASAGLVDGFYSLGRLYGDGRGVPKDVAKALMLLDEARARGYAYLAQQAINRLPPMVAAARADAAKPEPTPAPASSDKLPPLVREHLKKAEAGDASAQRELGALYMRGIDVPQDIDEGLTWYRKAAEQGDLTSQTTLGELYTFYKSGVPNDEEQGFHWYLKAAEQGDPQSQHKVGQMYANGRGVARDDRNAADWYRKSADQGFADGAIELGVMYEHGRGVAKDDELAMAWFAKAAAQGSARAEWIVGLQYESGTGVPSDFATAANWHRKAADQGYAPAQYCLAVLYENGRGVGNDLAEAIAWYRKAARQYYSGAEKALERLGVEVRPAV